MDLTRCPSQEVSDNWETIKAAERAAKNGGDSGSVVDGVPMGQPALSLAAQLLRRAERVGAPAELPAELPAEGFGARLFEQGIGFALVGGAREPLPFDHLSPEGDGGELDVLAVVEQSVETVGEPGDSEHRPSPVRVYGGEVIIAARRKDVDGTPGGTVVV